MTSKKQVVDEIHRSARKNFIRIPYEMRGIDDSFQIDLIEFIPYARENKGYKYALVVIDIFSKFAWTVAIKNKTGVEVTKAMKSVFDKSARICKNCQSDNGKEFYNKHFSKLMQENNINHYSTYSSMKASICERLNRTLLQKLWKQFSFQGNHKWLKSLEKITNEYNNTVHRTIKMKPVDVNISNEKYLLDIIYKRNHSLNVSTKEKFKIGDKVRISKFKTIFEKGYTPSWTTEIFEIDKIMQTEPISYLLKDLNNKKIEGKFYNHELQRTNATDIYLIEKVIRKQKDKLFVKWLGFDKKYNEWVNKNDIV